MEELNIDHLYSISNNISSKLYNYKRKLDEAKRTNAELENIKGNLVQVEELKSDIETKLNEFTVLDKLVNIEDTNYKQRRLDFLAEYIDDNLNVIFPSEGFKSKIICDTKYNSPKAYLKLQNNLGRVSTPVIGEGGLCQQLISFSSSAAITECLGLHSIYMDEAFTSASPENASNASVFLKILIDKGFQIILIEQNDDIYKDLPHREIVLERNELERCATIVSEQDY